jgi:hypothetical protein
MLLHNSTFVNAVVRSFAGDRLSITSVKAKFKTTDRSANTSGVETVPVILDDGNEFGAERRGEIRGYGNNRVKFGLVKSGIPETEVGARRKV